MKASLMVNFRRVHDIKAVVDRLAEVGKSCFSSKIETGGHCLAEYLDSSGHILDRMTLTARVNVPENDDKKTVLYFQKYLIFGHILNSPSLLS